MLEKIQKMMEKLMTAAASVLLGAMFAVITVNIILRLIPAAGGFKWYMEFSQYANVWAMLSGSVGIACAGTNLRVGMIDSIMKNHRYGSKFTDIIMDVAELIFYIVFTYSGFLLSARANQHVSTMPYFTMGHVYVIFPVTGILCVLAVLLHLAVTVTKKEG